MTDNETPMAYRSSNLVTGRQLRAARTLAGMTQHDLATVLAVNERAVRFWERKHDRRPTSAPNDARIEQALLARGVILFAEPTPGARLAERRYREGVGQEPGAKPCSLTLAVGNLHADAPRDTWVT